MKRPLVVFAVLLAMASCTREARPTGIVENWLRSLNQGPAGAPERFADDDVSEQVVPGWHDLDPGHLDVIEVGNARTTETGAEVSFRLLDIEGVETHGVAHLVAVGDAWRVASVSIDPASQSPPIEDARPAGIPVGWPLAAAFAVVASVAGVWVLTVVRRRADPSA